MPSSVSTRLLSNSYPLSAPPVVDLKLQEAYHGGSTAVHSQTETAFASDDFYPVHFLSALSCQRRQGVGMTSESFLDTNDERNTLGTSSRL